MAALHTYILVCDGAGCFNLFGHLPTHRTTGIVRRWAAKAGWVVKRGPTNTMIRDTGKFYETAIDLCPLCADGLTKLDPKAQLVLNYS